MKLIKLKHGIFDDATESAIGLSTLDGIAHEAGIDLDRRRFRANIAMETLESRPFVEDEWVGGTLVFGENGSSPAVSVTAPDVRCMMINLDPDTAVHDARVLKAVLALNGKNAGVYGTGVRTGPIRVGDPVTLVDDGRR